MKYGSICSGIEAATVAWHGLGWEPAFFSEIDNFPRAVLQHHYPNVPLHGDFTTINGDEYGHVDLLVGGTPCQDFSVAGLRAGFAGERGNLTLEFARLVDRMRPQWVVWENVPGVLSIDGGRAFGAFLGALAEIGYGFAYRILDAQYFGVAQRRRRVFVVGYLGDWRRAAAVLFERESLLGNPPPRREAGERPAPTISARTKGCGGLGTDFDCDGGLIAHSLRAEGFDASEDGTVRGTPLVAHAFDARQSDVIQYGDMTGPLDTDGHTMGVLAFSVKDHGADAGPISLTLRAGGHDRSHANGGVMPAVAYSIMPMNSGKDYKARETDVAQPIMAGGPVGGNQGGDFIVEPVLPVHFQGRGSNIDVGQDVAGTLGSIADRASGGAPCIAFDTTQITSKANYSNPKPGDPRHPLAAGAHAPAVAYPISADADRANSSALTPSPDAEGRVRLRDPGLGIGAENDPMFTLQATKPPAVAFDLRGREGGAQFEGPHDTANIHAASGGSSRSYVAAMQVRRLTPMECERLQGFSDGYTLVPYRGKPAADGPRYKSLGNSFAVPVVRWIGQRIQMVEALCTPASPAKK